jgi:hypothetical protein
MASKKNLYAISGTFFRGKQKFIRCGEYDLSFDYNCLQSGVKQTNASASTVKSDYKCDGFKKLPEDTAKKDSIAKSKEGSIINGG